MNKRRYQPVFTLCCVLTVVSAVVLSGCRKKRPDPSGEPSARQETIHDRPGMIVCDLKKVKLDKVELPNHQPYFIRDMERNDEDTLLKGELTIEDKAFTVILPLENRQEQMGLYETSTKKMPYWWGADDLTSIHQINGKYYEFDVLENKTKFAASPYTGETGVFKIGKGNRKLEKVEFNGSVKSKDASVAVGPIAESGWSKAVTEHRIPVGDYYPAIMSVTYDNIRISISNNYHRNAKGIDRGQEGHEEVYGFTIRKDKPYVLDFSNKPVVVFDTPAPEKNRFKVDEEVKFASVLVDPELDIMIRGLDDTDIEVEKEYVDSEGAKHTYKQKKSLDATVVITRADGQVVTEGVMPFG